MRVRAFFAVLAFSAYAHAADPAGAREQLKIGYELAHDGKYAEALPHLQESLRLDPKAITLINLANCEEKTGHLADALAHWADARAHAQSEDAPAIAEEATKRAKALEERIPRLTIVLGADAPKGTEVSKDGVVLGSVSLGVAVPVDIGEHVIVARAPGHAEAIKKISVAESESARIEIAPGGAITQPLPSFSAKEEPARGEKHTSPLVWIGFGTAAAGIAAGTVTGLLAMDRASEADRACPNRTCTDSGALDRIDGGRTLGTISTVAFVVAGLGVLVGAYGLTRGTF